MTAERSEELGLEMMSRNNRTRHHTAFTTSIEAAEGVTTGISAADRAHTVAVAIDPTKSKDDIVTPGHVFPLLLDVEAFLLELGIPKQPSI
jgi:3,4-dihydroxy 2-butanone 4-phosphate synthase/GTP cyclohydrolase II